MDVNGQRMVTRQQGLATPTRTKAKVNPYSMLAQVCLFLFEALSATHIFVTRTRFVIYKLRWNCMCPRKVRHYTAIAGSYWPCDRSLLLLWDYTVLQPVWLASSFDGSTWAWSTQANSIHKSKQTRRSRQPTCIRGNSSRYQLESYDRLSTCWRFNQY